MSFVKKKFKKWLPFFFSFPSLYIYFSFFVCFLFLLALGCLYGLVNCICSFCFYLLAESVIFLSHNHKKVLPKDICLPIRLTDSRSKMFPCFCFYHQFSRKLHGTPIPNKVLTRNDLLFPFL